MGRVGQGSESTCHEGLSEQPFEKKREGVGRKVVDADQSTSESAKEYKRGKKPRRMEL